MRTIEVVHYSSAMQEAGRAKIVLSKIITFAEDSMMGSVDPDKTMIWVENTAYPFISDESLDSFSARYEAAMDELESEQYQRSIARQVMEVTKDVWPVVVQTADNRCVHCGHYGNHVCVI